MTEAHATPAVRFGRHRYLTFYSESPWAQHAFRQGVIGEHARWEMEMARKYGEWRKWPRWRDMIPGRWTPMPPGLNELFIPWWAHAGGWLIALWVAWEALRG